MKRVILLFLLIILMIGCRTETSNLQNDKLVEYINPFIGTAGDHGQTDPSANIPFGMIKAGPDTDPTSHGGYDFNTTKLIGFSQNRISGTGCRGCGGNLRILPFLNPDEEYAEMDKTSEVASAGYYKIRFKNNITTEVTAARTSAIYRFKFPKGENSGIKIDFESSFHFFLDESHEIIDQKIVQGWIHCSNMCNFGKYKFYYYLLIDHKIDSLNESGGKAKFIFSANENQDAIVKIGLSTIGVEEAKENLEKEIGEKDFSHVKDEAKQSWTKLCNLVQVETSNDSLKELFYTHLYHMVQLPFNVADVSGKFRGSDAKVYNSDKGNYYTGWSLWDTFRTKLPMISIMDPLKYREMISSMYKLYEQGKSDNPTDTESFLHVRNEHTIPVLLDASRKGLLSQNLDLILDKMIDEAYGLSTNSPDKILEACYDYWALSQIAKDLGNEKIAQEFEELTLNYRDIWKEKFKVMDENSDIMHGDGLYEGTLWQYRWFVPYDFDWVITEIGGKEKTISQLDYFFENNLFNIGNQPDIHVPFLYYELGKPWKTQKLVRELLIEETVNNYGTHKKWDKPYVGKIFRNHPEGFLKEMDDDAGTMSGWYVLSAIGLYPRNIGETEYYVLPSIFDQVSINITNGQKLEIKNIKTSKKDIYIQRVTLNGQELKRSWITYDEISSGGILELYLSENPNKSWGLE